MPKWLPELQKLRVRARYRGAWKGVLPPSFVRENPSEGGPRQTPKNGYVLFPVYARAGDKKLTCRYW